jgi:hypothetical protein
MTAGKAVGRVSPFASKVLPVSRRKIEYSQFMLRHHSIKVRSGQRVETLHDQPGADEKSRKDLLE